MQRFAIVRQDGTWASYYCNPANAAWHDMVIVGLTLFLVRDFPLRQLSYQVNGLVRRRFAYSSAAVENHCFQRVSAMMASVAKAAGKNARPHCYSGLGYKPSGN
jgi:hypothetical protein